MFIRLPPESHLLKSLHLGLAFLASQVVRCVPDLVTFFFVIVAQFFFEQSFLVLYLHVDWVVHQALSETINEKYLTFEL